MDEGRRRRQEPATFLLSEVETLFGSPSLTLWDPIPVKLHDIDIVRLDTISGGRHRSALAGRGAPEGGIGRPLV